MMRQSYILGEGSGTPSEFIMSIHDGYCNLLKEGYKHPYLLLSYNGKQKLIRYMKSSHAIPGVDYEVISITSFEGIPVYCIQELEGYSIIEASF